MKNFNKKSDRFIRIRLQSNQENQFITTTSKQNKNAIQKQADEETQRRKKRVDGWINGGWGYLKPCAAAAKRNETFACYYFLGNYYLLIIGI